MEVKDDKPTILYFGKILKKQSTLFGVILLINILAIFVGSTGASTTGSASLDITNLQDVLTSLREVHFGSDKWHDLGLALGLFDNRLRGIKANTQGEVDECLKECLSKWLGRVDKVDEKGGTTWAALAKALRKIGDKPAAEHIEKSYVTGVSKSQSQAQSSSNTCTPDSHEDTESCAADIAGEPSATTVVLQKTGNKNADDAGKLETVPDPPDVSEYCPPMRDIEDQHIDTLPDDINIILVTATKIEFRAAIGQAKPLEGKNYGLYSNGDIVFYVGYYGSYKVAIIETGQGYKETSRKLEPVQNALGAQYVISIGICYGMKPGKVKLGDVIVGTKIKDLYNKRVSHGDVHVRSDEYEPGTTLSRMFGLSAGFKLSRGDTEYVDIKFGVLVTETTLVASQEYKNNILKQVPEALGGEMEAAGIMEAARKAKFEAIVMKAVADWGNEKKEPYRKWQEFAAVAAAKYVLYHLEKSPKMSMTKPLY